MGNILSVLSTSQCFEIDKMQSPLLLSLLQEKLGDDNTIRYVNISKYSPVHDRINDNLKYKRESDSFLSSPLYEGAKEEIRLRAKQNGWVREDPEPLNLTPSVSPNPSVEHQISPITPQSEPPRTPESSIGTTERPPTILLQWPHMGSDGEKVTFDTYAHHLRHMLTLKGDESSIRSSREMHSRDYHLTSHDLQSNDVQRTYSLRSCSTGGSTVRDIGWDDDEPMKRHNSIRKSLDPRNPSTPPNRSSGVSWTKKLRTFGNRKHQMRDFAEELRFDTIRENEPLSVDGINPSSIQTQTTVDSNTVDRVLAAGPNPKPMAPRLKDRSFAFYHGMISM